MTTILIVDDDDITCDLVRRMLKSMGFSVVIASSGQPAIEIAEEVKPNLIIMDLLLPDGMNGWDAAEAIRALPDMQHVPIFAMTAASGLQSPLDVFDEFIRKPFDLKNMETLIWEYIDN
jgi:CheY-like chemotaxis protein